MSLIRDIQVAAISQDTDVPTLLRMCKLLAARISNEPFGQWVEAELDGYPNVESLPPYRRVHVDSYGRFYGSFAQAQRLQIPISILPPEYRDRFQNAYILNGISAYVTLAQGDKSGTCRESWPMEIAVKYASKAMVDMQCIEAWKEIPIGAIVRLLDSVKTRVLGFAIDLEREAPDAGESPVGGNPVSQDKVTQIFNTNITGGLGSLSNAGSNFSQTAYISVQPGNWPSLKAYLSSLGLTDTDVEGLRADLDRVRSGQQSTTGTLETIPETWIEKLKIKVGQIAGGVGVEIAVAGITSAIAAYLGKG